jgi:hypothetical protein
MSRNINVNPDHYKGAGRERQGENVVQREERRAFERQQALNERWQGAKPPPDERTRGGQGRGERQRDRAGATPKAERRQTGRRRDATMTRQSGISNRQSAAEEQQERQQHPPLDTNSPPPEDAAGRVGETAPKEVPDRQTSHKAGSRSIAQKEDAARYPDRSMPASRKVPGAFGKEPRAGKRSARIAESPKNAR